MIAIEVRIEALEPILVTGLQGDANAKRSLAYLPGSALRGALIARYLRRAGRERLEPDAPQQGPLEWRLFFSTATRYLPGYPVVGVHGQRRRGLPTPLSWRRDKQPLFKDGSEVYDLAILPAAALDIEKQVVAPGKAFCGLDEHHVYFADPTYAIHVHTARSRIPGRATAREGELFQYEALAAGQEFIALILLDQTDDTQQDAQARDLLLDLLQEERLELGGSRWAGYGAVRLATHVAHAWRGETGTRPLPLGGDAIPPSVEEEAEEKGKALALGDDGDDSAETAAEYAGYDDDTGYEDDTGYDEDGGYDEDSRYDEDEDDGVQCGGAEQASVLRLTSLSPWLLYDDAGQPAASLTSARLASLLGLEARQLVPVPEQSHFSLTLIGGFNRAWGLPLPQRHALAPGSVFVFEVAGPLPATLAAKLAALEDAGIGEQRGDGCGRVAVNWQQRPALTYTVSTLADATQEALLPEADQPLARSLGERILRAELEIALAERIHARSLANREAIRNSLLNRLRSAARARLAELQQLPPAEAAALTLADATKPFLQPLHELVDGLERPAAEQLQRARFWSSRKGEQTRLSAWLRTRLTQVDQLWVDENLGGTPMLELGGVKVTAPPIWLVEYTLRLIDGVLAQAARTPRQTPAQDQTHKQAQG